MRLHEHIKRIAEQVEEFACLSLYRFVLDNGRYFGPVAECPRSLCGVPKNCFCNAASVAMSESHYTYCEGYVMAAGIVPIVHAWLIDKRGRVVDPTLHDAKPDDEYYGIPFRLSFVQEIALRNGTYGILECPQAAHFLATRKSVLRRAISGRIAKGKMPQ